jgi:hypothetical protein
MSLKPKLNKKEALARARKAAGPTWRADGHLLIAMVPDFHKTPVWRETEASPLYETWRNSAYDVERVQAAIALGIIRNLRGETARKHILEGDLFWTVLAINVLRSQHHWHQSGRIRLVAMRGLRGRLGAETITDKERRSLTALLEQYLLRAVDEGAGEEFKALTRIAKAIGTTALVKQLEERVNDAQERPTRNNAQRMLDCINGKPYRPYRG